jgi:hypothetical protein
MKSFRKKELRNFYKFLTLAQTSSDAGKFCFPPSHNNATAVKEGYDLKDQYILHAAAIAKKAGVKVWWEWSDIPRLKTIVYFETAFGQVSFHTHLEGKVCEKIASAPTGKWNGVRGGSRRVCDKASALLQLQTR